EYCLPPGLASIHSLPGEGPHPDAPTAVLPLVKAGLATNAIPLDLTNRAALIQRGTSPFSEKIDRAAQAGARFAVIYNNVDGSNLVHMEETDFSPIPAVFIGQTDGEWLASLLERGSNVMAQLRLESAEYAFAVTNCLLLEHVAVRVATNHSRRGDVRITLLSPQGTRSVMQRLNFDESPGPADWTYYSTHHFYESSVGTWTVSVSDEEKYNTGSVQSVSLILNGVPITDRDHDGLDDDWELARLESLDYGPRDDPDQDGFSNMREQIMGTDPLRNEQALQLDLSVWNNSLIRLSWPSCTNLTYEIWAGDDPLSPLNWITNIPGGFPETEWFTPYTRQKHLFLRVTTADQPAMP
ncbi:MAG: proprotein convertase P-domain-containing protein, partial [Candidatus Omnitrophica bacterium]|nr:proprotein convertase P-domain-containing protein [Candidatus Omnitrophota bacterium]